MRHKVLFFLIALIALPLSAADNSQQSNNASKNSDKQLEFQYVPVPEALKQKIASTTLASGGGNEFYCLLPPNDRSASVGNVSVYICSGEDCSAENPTIVMVERAGITGAIATFSLEAPGISVALTATDGSGVQNGKAILDRKAIELLHSKRSDYSSRTAVRDKSLKITSEGGDVFVYVGSFSSATAEGYMVLPTHLLGNRYIHCSFEDNDETGRKTDYISDPGGYETDYRTGFSVIATEDNTTVTAHLKSNLNFCLNYDRQIAPNSGSTTVISPPLGKGHIWSVVNGLNAERNQACDFTGTIVESDKNFAMISWQQRTGIPTFAMGGPSGGGRDNLVEQLLPIVYWGTEFVSVQFKGTYENQSEWRPPTYTDVWDNNPGQFFRVTASQPGTEFSVTYYDLQTMKKHQNWTDKLNVAGAVAEKGRGVLPPQAPIHGISGAAIWTSNKPIQIMQYMHSGGVLYNTYDIDPCMVLIPPTSQYGHNTTFKTAPYTNNSTFNQHYVTLYIKGPVNEDGTPNTEYTAIQKCLESINAWENGGAGAKYRIVDKDKTIYGNRIEGTPYYFARWAIPADMTVYVYGETPISGTVYGWGSVISYAWPVAMGLVKVGTLDMDPPIVESSYECSIVSRFNTNNRIDTGKVMIQSQWWDTVFIEGSEFEDAIVDEGLNRRPTLREETDNIDLTSVRYHYYDPWVAPSGTWTSGNQYKQGAITYTTKNPYEDVIGYIMYEDAAGWQSVDTITYISDKIRFYDISDLDNPLTSISFGSVVTGSTAVKTIVIKNINTEEYTIFPTNIEELALRYNYFQISQPSRTTLLPGDTVHITISYTPTTTDNLLDYLHVNTQCLAFGLSISAGSGFPRINVSDIPFGSVPVGRTSDPREFTITNNGSLDLTITGANFNPAQPGDPVQDTFEFVTIPEGTTYLTALPTVAAPWVIPAGESVKARLYYHARVAGPATGSFCFESDADPNLDVDYDNCALLTGTGIETGVTVTPAIFGRRRVCSQNVEAALITNNGNFSIVLRDITGNNGKWKPYVAGSDTLWSQDNSYFITGILDLIGDTLYPHSDASHPLDQREFYVQVHFNPVSEAAPTYGTAEQEISYSVNFEPVEGISSIVGTGNATGQAYLPKLEPNGYTFPNPTKYGTQHNPSGDIVLNNPSYTSGTRIFRVRILHTDQYQDFWLTDSSLYLDNSPEYVPDANTGGKYSIEVNFQPVDASPTLRRCPVEIVSDAYTTCGGDTLRYDTIWLQGEAYDDSWVVNDPDLGTFARCDNQSRPISVLNNGTIPLVIDSVSVGGVGFANVMRLNLPAGVQFPITVGAGSTNEDLHFTFEGCNYIDDAGNPLEGTTSIPITVHTNMGSKVATYSANPLYIPVALSLPTINNTAPGLRITVPVSINIANTNNAFYSFANAKILGFSVTINVKRAQLYFEGFEAVIGWQYTFVQTDDNVTITGTCTDPAYALVEGAIVYPYAVVMVGTDGVIPMSISDISFDRTCCVRLMNTTDGEVNFDICAQVPRGDILTSNVDYALEPIAPNPFTEKTLPINYSIGLDAQTTINIFNSNGDLVKVAIDEYQKTGIYTTDINISDLATGVYQITITSGPFEATQPLVIVR